VCTHTGFVILLFWTVQKLVRNRPPQWFESLLFCYFVILLFCYFGRTSSPQILCSLHSTQPRSRTFKVLLFCYFGRLWKVDPANDKEQRTATRSEQGCGGEKRGTRKVVRAGQIVWVAHVCFVLCSSLLFTVSVNALFFMLSRTRRPPRLLRNERLRSPTSVVTFAARIWLRRACNTSACATSGVQVGRPRPLHRRSKKERRRKEEAGHAQLQQKQGRCLVGWVGARIFSISTVHT
jgi:hypothetical protein